MAAEGLALDDYLQGLPNWDVWKRLSSRLFALTAYMADWVAREQVSHFRQQHLSNHTININL